MIGPTIGKGELDGGPGADDRGWSLEEDPVPLDRVELPLDERAHLLDVEAVVDGGCDDLAREDHGGVEPRAVRGRAGSRPERLLEGRAQPVEPGDGAQEEHGRPLMRPAADEIGDVHDLAVSQEPDALIVVDHEPHGSPRSAPPGPLGGTGIDQPSKLRVIGWCPPWAS